MCTHVSGPRSHAFGLWFLLSLSETAAHESLADNSSRSLQSSGCHSCAAGRFLACPLLSEGQTCQNCLVGTYNGLNGATICQSCSTGTYTQGQQATSCSICAAGWYGNPSSTCLRCQAGKVSLAGSLTSAMCTSCPLPSSSFSGDSQCTHCAPGYYKSGTSSQPPSFSTCTQCPLGKMRSTPGAVAVQDCVNCGTGKYSNTSGTTACDNCPLGKYWLSWNQCVDCPGGRYSMAPGTTQCHQCQRGTYRPSGSTTIPPCSQCPAGTYQPTLGASSLADCLQCAAGKTSAPGAVDATSCTDCPSGKATLTSGSGCVGCPAGRYSQTTTTCDVCPAGKHAPTNGTAQCQNCPGGKFRASVDPNSVTCQGCAMGRYLSATGATYAAACQPCPSGTYFGGIGASAQSQCTQCVGGKYSVAGSSVCSICGRGEYSTAGSQTCQACPPGQVATALQSSECTICTAGTYRLGTGSLSATQPCNSCLLGKFSLIQGATNSSVCTSCAKGLYSSLLAASTCSECGNNKYGSTEGSTECATCPGSSTSPGGALGCCPNNKDDTWPISASLYTAPGKSETPIYLLSSCSTAALSNKQQLKISTATNLSANSLTGEIFVATLKSSTEIQECRSLRCNTQNCFVSVQSDTDVFEAGQSFKITAHIRSARVPANGLLQCSQQANIMVAGFGCAPNTLSHFLLALTGVIVGTMLLGVLLEWVERSRQIVYVENSLDVRIPSGSMAALPTDTIVRENLLRGLQLEEYQLPREYFSAFVVPSTRSDFSCILHIDFAVKAGGQKHHQMVRRELVQNVWIPKGSWQTARVEQQLPSLLKVKGSLPGMDLIDLGERCCLCMSGRKDHDAERHIADLHGNVARELLKNLLSRKIRNVLILQYFANLGVAGSLSCLAYYQMDDCHDGFPLFIHGVWLAWVAISGLCSLLLLRCCGGPHARAFVWRCRMRLLLRYIFTFIMVTDTYQDATFPVIAKTCSFDLWFVSAWLVILGIGVMQVLAQILVLLVCSVKYARARTPEEQERLMVEGVFLALRGSDNLVLVYAIKPAVEERLGGSSSWAMKMTEARIAFLRFIFEDVEQSALQVVFLLFYEDAALMDKIWVSFSIATALLLSFTLVVQCMPQVRDWLWYRVLARFPGARRVKILRVGWLLLCIVFYRAISIFPWISACSPRGDACNKDDDYYVLRCQNGETVFFGLPARMEVVNEVLKTSAGCIAGLAVVILLSCLWWSARSLFGRRGNQWHDYKAYSAARRFSSGGEPLRPKSDDDDDLWLEPARQLRALAIDGGAAEDPEVIKVVETIDKSVFQITRAPASYRVLPCRRVGRKLKAALEKLPKVVGDAGRDLAVTLHREASQAEKLAYVKWNTQKLLADRHFSYADLREKSQYILKATGQQAPLRFIHWAAIDKQRELPKCGATGGATTVEETLKHVADILNLSAEQAERHIVPFFLSHRWLRTRGPKAGHHPDSENHIKAQKLVTFARWFMALASRARIRCEVVFWIDWCCCDQDDPLKSDISTAALPLYIASCMKVVNWRTPDFDRRCWTMVERLLSYSFCVGGLTPYVIDESFVDIEEAREAWMDRASNSNVNAGSARSVRSIRSSGSSSGIIHEVVDPDADPCDAAMSIWQVNLGSKWVEFGESAQARLRKARQDGESEVRLQLRGNNYDINLRRMVQINIATKMERPIREVRFGAKDDTQVLPASMLSSRVSSSMPSSSNDFFAPLDSSGSARPAAAFPAEEDGPETIGKVNSVQSADGDKLLQLSQPAGKVATIDEALNLPRLCRARKLPNPLDFETCQVTRPSDRRRVAQLVDVALAVPALEVFADRQPVEWGLTEIIEQSLAVRTPLPSKWASPDGAPSEWLQPSKIQKGEWQLVVESAAEKKRAPGIDATDAFIWVDYGSSSTGGSVSASPLPPEELDDLFFGVDLAVENADGVEDALRALIEALKLDLQFAMGAGDEEGLVAAIFRTREVELPEKQRAIEQVCDMRLNAALSSGSESAMRGALRMARTYGAEHTSAFAATLKEQQELYGLALKKKLEDQMTLAANEENVQLLFAVHRTAIAHGMSNIESEALRIGKKQVEGYKDKDDLRGLDTYQQIVAECGWKELDTYAKAAKQELTLTKALNAAMEREDIPAIRCVEEEARKQGRPEIAEIAKERATEVAEKVGQRLREQHGLPAEWDVVLDMAGLSGLDKPRLKKSEETDIILLERIQRLVDETFTGWGGLGKHTRTRDRAKEPIADRLEVKSVVYVQNCEGFINYRARREKIASEMPASARRNWDIKTNRVTFDGLSRHQTNPLDPSINEYYLWHGTTPYAAARITDAEFDLKRAGQAYGALFGPGIYFAESSMKADEYTKVDKRGWFPLILCRVVCGHINYCDAGDPTKISKELEASCKPGSTHHSVLGDREKVRGTFREFIVFDNHQVYPEYIVWYTRKDPK